MEKSDNYRRGAVQYALGLAEAARENRAVWMLNGTPWSWCNEPANYVCSLSWKHRTDTNNSSIQPA